MGGGGGEVSDTLQKPELSTCEGHLTHVWVCVWGGEGVLPYMAFTGTYRRTGYGFWPPCPEQGI